MDIYICSAVSQVKELHQDAIALFPDELTLYEFLERQAHILSGAHKSKDVRVCVQISNWHPKLVGSRRNEILTADFTLDDAHIVVAREYGFASWQDVLNRQPSNFDPNFENAVNAVVTGNKDLLTNLLDSDLVHARSHFGHHSTLLHYIAANGVETWRQTVPRNAPEIVRLLLKEGADVSATAKMYGGEHTTLSLLLTSAHPAEAGVSDEIAEILREAGTDIAEPVE